MRVTQKEMGDQDPQQDVGFLGNRHGFGGSAQSARLQTTKSGNTQVADKVHWKSVCISIQCGHRESM